MKMTLNRILVLAALLGFVLALAPVAMADPRPEPVKEADPRPEPVKECDENGCA